MYQQSNGHWIAPLPKDSNLPYLELFHSGFTGYVKRYLWNTVDTAEGYNFDAVLVDLDYCARRGKRLIVMIGDKTFDNVNPVPDDMRWLGVQNRSGGYTAVRWHQEVAERFDELLRRLYDELRTHLAFEGVMLQETALGFDDEFLKSMYYTPALYADYYLRLFRRCAGYGGVADPNKRVFWNQNYMAKAQQGGIDSIVDATLAEGLYNVVMGGPDCCPKDPELLEKVYPRYPKYEGKVPKFINMSLPSYRQGTPAELLKYARQTLGVNYVTWTFDRSRWPAVSAVVQADI